MGSRDIEWIVFDVGNVLFGDALGPKLKDLTIKYNLDDSVGRRSMNAHRAQADLGRIDEPEFWRRVLLDCGVVADEADCSIAPYIFPVAESIEVVKDCRSRGFYTAIISNDSFELSRLRKLECNAGALFHEIVISSNYGVTKPSRELYEVFLGRVRTSADRCLFVDDCIDNVCAADELGFHTYHFESSRGLAGYLQTLSAYTDS